ncbi:MAG: RHS repeat-associated core domain-containing protein, partial [Terriglobia bacterium]
MFGNRSSVTGYATSDDTRQKFAGKERDNETALDNFRARYYIASLGRFTAVDPLQPTSSSAIILGQFTANPQNWNKFSYTRNNPVTFTDQSGKFSPGNHEEIQRNAMVTRYYSFKAIEIASRSNRNMDGFKSDLGGVKYFNKIVSYNGNPLHGESNQGQVADEARRINQQYTKTEIKLGAAAAILGYSALALEHLGQASHASQD